MLESGVQVAPSILSADLGRLADELASIGGASYVHFDVMDGHFVPNLTFGPGVLAAVKGATRVPVDAHLMVSNPDQMVPAYLDAGADVVTFHYEATAHASRLASLIREGGAKVGIAINPGTPVSALDAIIEDVDLVLVMTVNPGFGGQKFIPGSLRKLRQLKAMCDERRVSPIVEVDGGISPATAADVCAAGARLLVAGSAVFGKPDRADAIRKIAEAGEAGRARRA
ncbi:MAG: ribulose-phosphate 3-epimerase [Coriobacteriaceae bacterium]|uniref:ribulose-phosphate 3-epimerase n=1 Tax=Tractidigestivibacter sp. TaxID=2847320 RepID=UPI002A7F436F|nr:ribulose-phosphate 3-epimerase [Tractidigestivibacter sp.]MCI6844010.1 ribulose-phosphate 3-epimerase [Coriobacteriaceae bacterium]MDD7583740.1 ribulose-phosphate 3-epimerase [Coriobacteriaceae bacterium]MDY4534314.1 ribulose-phosphate 3-epimerase [Tractidigestivibacter sp.]